MSDKPVCPITLVDALKAARAVLVDWEMNHNPEPAPMSPSSEVIEVIDKHLRAMAGGEHE